MESQRLALPAAIKATILRVTVVEAKAGKRYPDLVISELRLWDDQGPLRVHTEDDAARRTALRNATKGTLIGELLGQRLSAHIVEGTVSGNGTLKLRPDSSFVFWQDRTNNDASGEDNTEWSVVDGTFSVTDNDSKAASIELFARKSSRRLLEESYARKRSIENTRVFGGKLQLEAAEASRCSDTYSDPARGHVGRPVMITGPLYSGCMWRKR